MASNDFTVYDVDTMTGTLTGAAGAGLREDLQKIITNISPKKTPFFSTCPKDKAHSPFHDWLTDSYAAPSSNARVEGAAHSSGGHTARKRYRNYTQIIGQDIEVTGTLEASTLAGVSSEFAYQRLKAAKEQALDIEWALWNETENAGASGTARHMRGIKAVLQASGNVSSATADRAITRAIFEGAWEDAYDDGADCDVVYCTMARAMNLSGLIDTGYGTRQVPAGGGGDRIYQAIRVYEGNLGTLTVKVTRYCASDAYFILESSLWKVATLRPVFTKPIAPTGDSMKALMLGEITLEFSHPDGGAIIEDINA